MEEGGVGGGRGEWRKGWGEERVGGRRGGGRKGWEEEGVSGGRGKRVVEKYLDVLTPSPPATEKAP